MKEKKVFSNSIAEYCGLVSDAADGMRAAKDEMDRLEALTQDYLHALELGDLNYRERAKIATKLSECRRERREVKDEYEVLEQFVIFSEEKESRTYMNKLREILGKVRSAERRHKNRIYTPKVMKDTNGIFDQKRKE